jgi:hypothetical protein
MFKVIEGLEPDVMAIEAIGWVTHEDYRDVLIPKAGAMIGNGPIKSLYVLGNKFAGFQLEALADDSGFELQHWRDFSQIAVVTDHGWLQAVISVFLPFFHSQIRLLTLADLPAAKSWIAGAAEGHES